MGANMRCEKNSLALLSSKRTKAFSRTRADEAFALPSFCDVVPTFTIDSPCRSSGVLKVEHYSNDVERLKQTMLQHESMFKEQLYELHRLYQVQRSLMEDSKRKGLAAPSHPCSDSPSSNSSFLYNPDACKPKGESRFWDVEEMNKSSLCKQLSFFPGLTDMNKPHEGKTGCAERQVNVSYPKDNPRPIIDLEKPAEEHVDIEVEEEKPPVKDMFPNIVGNSHACNALENSMPSEEIADVHTISMHRESIGRTRRSLEDCFIPEHSRHKESSFSSSLGLNKNGDGDTKLCHVQAAPITSLFGVRLDQGSTNREKQTHSGHNNLEERRKEPPIHSTNTCNRSTGEPLKLPHWLLQGTPTKMSPVKATLQSLLRQHEMSPSVHDERKADSIFDDRVCSVAPQELSSSWPKNCTGLQFGGSLLRAPQSKPSLGYFPDASTGNVWGLHKLAQTRSSIESVPYVPYVRDERDAGGLHIPASAYASSPTSNGPSPLYDTNAAPAGAAFLQNLCSKGPINGALMPSWYEQQKASSPLMPQVSKPGVQLQRPGNAAFPVNFKNTWAASSVHADVQSGFLARGTLNRESRRDLKGSTPSSVMKPEFSSKRLIFEFMPTASDLELTLGLDLNESGAFEIPRRVEDSSVFENVVQRDNSMIELESKPMNDFDLNVQSGQVLEARCHEEHCVFLPGSRQGHEAEISHECTTLPGVEAVYNKEWQTLCVSSGMKNIPEVAVTSTVTPLWRANSAFTKGHMHRESPFPENLCTISANGKTSDGSELGSCESKSIPIPASPKAQVDSNTSSGEQCQRGKVKISHVFQGDIAENLLGAKCTDVIQNGKVTANNSQNHAMDLFSAADILLHLGLDLSAPVIEDHDTDDQERALKWLADIIPQEDTIYMGAGMVDLATRESTLRAAEPSLEEGAGFQGGRVLDSFELAVLRLEPINPDTEKICTPPIEKSAVAVDCSPYPNLRRRSQRRGRVAKDFQKEMLPSMASLSRQEITEDLQIIEGLVKSATEAMARCSLSPDKEEVMQSLPDLSSVKTFTKAKSSRSCKPGKQQPNGLLRVCSWGELTGRRRMRRQRSQWMCLPPGV